MNFMREQTSTETKKFTDSMLGQFFSEQIKDMYWAEQHLVKTLPEMQKAANSDKLKQAFGDHLAQTEQHVTRLEQVFEMMDMEPDSDKCKAMAGITAEGEEIIDETEEGTATRDAALIFAAQKVEHYEITSYGGLISLARCLNRSDIAAVLGQTLEEEKSADNLLTQIAGSGINQEACSEMN
jgi:ferritin-like metal-binding protein YciE